MKYDTHLCLVSAQATPNLIAAIELRAASAELSLSRIENLK